MKYKKKPVVIEAIQWKGTKESFDEIIDTFQEMVWSYGDIGSYQFKIETLEGWHTASKDDYIIKGIKGEFYPCKPDVFRMTYDEVED